MAIPFKPADPTVDGYITAQGGWKVDALITLRELIHEAAPEVQESIRKKLPHFDLDGRLCFIRAYDNHINLAFFRGTELDDPTGALLNYGKDEIRHVKLSHVEDIDPDVIKALVCSAVELNRAG